MSGEALNPHCLLRADSWVTWGSGRQRARLAKRQPINRGEQAVVYFDGGQHNRWRARLEPGAVLIPALDDAEWNEDGTRR